MEWYEAAFDRFYPILYSHRDADEAALAIDTFGAYLEGSEPILDLASGDGRYLKALIDAGYEAYGLDLSHYLLSRAVSDPELRGRMVQGDMRHLPFSDESVGAVINMFTSFGYFSVDTDNLLVFREVHRVLRRGGVFLLDFINTSRISADALADTRRESQGFDIRERRVIEDHGKYLVKYATIREIEGSATETIEERLRLYSRDDLLVMLKSVSLRVIDMFGDYKGNEFVDGVSDRIILLCERS